MLFRGRPVSKGKQVYIGGRIQSKEWEDSEGNKRVQVEIVARDMQLLESKKDEAPASDKKIPF